MMRDEKLREVRAGQYMLVRYNVEEELYHQRFLCQALEGSAWMVLTPDGDIYDED